MKGSSSTDEEAETEGFRTYPRPQSYPVDDQRYDGTRADLVLPLVGVVLYSTPAIVLLLPELLLGTSIIDWLPSPHILILWAGLAVLPIALGSGVFLYLAAKSGSQDTLPAMWPLVEQLNVPTHEMNDRTREALMMEYETVAAEARYRDQLLLRTCYFSLATFAGLMTLFNAVNEPRYQTSIAMSGTLFSLVFAIAVVSYKDARDPLWERMRVIELHGMFKDKLTSFHTIRTRGERRLFDRLSLSGYIVTLQTFFIILWLLAYLVTSFVALRSQVLGL